MTKDSYLKELRDNLYQIPQEEVNNIIQYYAEYFDEAGADNVQNVIRDLGSPKQLADKVTADYFGGNMPEVELKSKKHINVWLIVAAVLGAPLWIPLVLAALIVALALVIVMFALVVSFGAIVLACAIGGVVMSFASFAVMFSDAATGILLLGIGLVCLSITILMVFATIGIVILIKKLYALIFKKNRNVEG